MRSIEAAIADWHRATHGTPDDRIVGCKLGEEAGEVQGALIKIPEGRATADDLKDEIGDVLICLAVLSARNGWNLPRILSERFHEVSTRSPAPIIDSEGDPFVNNERVHRTTNTPATPTERTR